LHRPDAFIGSKYATNAFAVGALTQTPPDGKPTTLPDLSLDLTGNGQGKEENGGEKTPIK